MCCPEHLYLAYTVLQYYKRLGLLVLVNSNCVDTAWQLDDCLTKKDASAQRLRDAIA